MAFFQLAIPVLTRFWPLKVEIDLSTALLHD